MFLREFPLSCTLLSGCLVAPSAAASQEPIEQLRVLFRKPLVIGASISADHRTASPGRLLARRFGTEDRLGKFAWPGAYGQQVVDDLAPSLLARSSIVIGLDLFFWDATRQDCGRGITAMDKLLKNAAALGRPVVLGTIPDLDLRWYESLFGIPSLVPQCRDALNVRLRQSCGESSGCLLLDVEGYYRELNRSNAVLLDGRKYSKRDLMPDGRHLSETGSEWVARLMLELLERRLENKPGVTSE